jgi:hypothetical protein
MATDSTPRAVEERGGHTAVAAEEGIKHVGRTDAIGVKLGQKDHRLPALGTARPGGLFLWNKARVPGSIPIRRGVGFEEKSSGWLSGRQLILP